VLAGSGRLGGVRQMLLEEQEKGRQR
jgi:hypothetical protein